MSEHHVEGRVELKPGDEVLVRYGSFEGQSGEVVEVLQHKDVGWNYEIAKVRLVGGGVEGFDPRSLLKKD